MKANENHTIYVSSHEELVVTVEDVTVITGGVVVWVLARSVDADPVISKSSETVTEISLDGNTFTVYLTPIDTVELNPDYTYYHEARLTDEYGNTRPVMSGLITVRDTATI